MKSLLLLNGSPRGERSNSMKMLARVAEGWQQGGGEPPQVLHLARRDHFDRAIAAYAKADVMLLGMPLYTDSMPALVKFYLEALAPYVADSNHPTLSFLVQSGFPEAMHARPLERYLEKLAKRFNAPYAGTIVRGGGESLQMMPEDACKKLWAQLRTLGEELAQNGRFRDATLRKFAGTEHFSSVTSLLLSLALRLPITQFYWNGPLKKNGSWKKRFAAPYGEAL